jgi:hypothetical protein
MQVIKGGGNNAATMDAYNVEAYNEYNEKALDRCEGCGRTFLPDRLIVHMRSCKGSGGPKKATTGGLSAT